MASWAGQAIFLSSTMTGPGLFCSLSAACLAILSDSYISSMRTRIRP
jgi:hypothetical protein